MENFFFRENKVKCIYETKVENEIEKGTIKTNKGILKADIIFWCTGFKPNR